jgi:hypothetical protein
LPVSEVVGMGDIVVADREHAERVEALLERVVGRGRRAAGSACGWGGTVPGGWWRRLQSGELPAGLLALPAVLRC